MVLNLISTEVELPCGIRHRKEDHYENMKKDFILKARKGLRRDKARSKFGIDLTNPVFRKPPKILDY